MANYGRIDRLAWRGDTFSELNHDAMLIAVYLITAPGGNTEGLFWCPVEIIAKDLRMGFEGASKGLRSLIEAGFCLYDDRREYVFLVSALKWQAPEGDNRLKGSARVLSQLRPTWLRGPVLEQVRAYCPELEQYLEWGDDIPEKPRGFEGASKGVRRGLEGASNSPSPSPSPSPTQNQTLATSQRKTEPHVEEAFNAMWAAWPKRDGSDRKGHKTKAKAAFVRAAQSRGNDLTDLDQALRNYLAAVHNGNRPPKDCERFWQATEWPDWVDIEPGVVVRRTNGTNVQDHYEQRTRMLAEWARQKEQHHQHDQDEDLF